LVELMAEGWPDEYPCSVVSTLSLSVQRLVDEHRAAVALLRLCAFLAGEEIRIEVLWAGAGGLPEPLRDGLCDELAIDRTVAALRRYSLAEREGDGLRAHCVVQSIVRGSLPTAEYRAWLGGCGPAAGALLPGLLRRTAGAAADVRPAAAARSGARRTDRR